MCYVVWRCCKWTINSITEFFCYYASNISLLTLKIAWNVGVVAFPRRRCRWRRWGPRGNICSIGKTSAICRGTFTCSYLAGTTRNTALCRWVFIWIHCHCIRKMVCQVHVFLHHCLNTFKFARCNALLWTAARIKIIHVLTLLIP